MRGGLIALTILAAPVWAAAQVVSQEPEAAAVTIYRDGDGETVTGFWSGLAQITETRVIEVPAGLSKISFRGVAETLVAQTVAIEGLSAAPLERNLDYDLLSPASLVEKSIGKRARLVRTDRASGRSSEIPVTIRSGKEGVVLETPSGLEALSCSGWPERLVFDEAPAGLADKPTLSVLADTPRAGRYKVRLSYLATGFGWSADYVARIRPDGRSLDLLGWLTLTNATGASFGQAPTEVVAGELARDGDTAPVVPQRAFLANRCWGGGVADAAAMGISPLPVERRSAMVEEVVVTAAKIAKQSDLGDYKLYSLPEPTTIAAHQTKQVRFLDQKAVSFDRVYVYRVRADEIDAADDDLPEHPTLTLRLLNTVARGLGKPLPAGVYSVMEAGRSGTPILIGEHRARDAPVGSPLELELGRSIDIVVTPRVLAEHDDEVDIEVELDNRKAEPVVLEYRQALEDEDLRVVSASRRQAMKAGDALWTLRLGPGERTTLHYTLAEVD